MEPTLTETGKSAGMLSVFIRQTKIDTAVEQSGKHQSKVLEASTSLLDEILKGCRKRRRDSQKRLYKMFYAYGMSITLYYADSRDEAAEILNDGFLKVFQNIKSFDQTRSFKPWFRRILINTAIDHFHKHKKHRQSERFELHENSIAADEKILSGISYREIIDLVQKLSPAYRTVFNLYVIEGYKHKEVAKALDISVGTSKSNLHKAKQNLQAMLIKNLT